jgi:hypothetical protein
MNRLLSFFPLSLVVAGFSFPLLAQPPVTPVESVEAPQVPTGTSEDIQGIEKGYNNWSWQGERPDPNSTEEYPYKVTPDSYSPQETTDDFKWENTGEPESSGATVPFGKF